VNGTVQPGGGTLFAQLVPGHGNSISVGNLQTSGVGGAANSFAPTPNGTSAGDISINALNSITTGDIKAFGGGGAGGGPSNSQGGNGGNGGNVTLNVPFAGGVGAVGDVTVNGSVDTSGGGGGGGAVTSASQSGLGGSGGAAGSISLFSGPGAVNVTGTVL